MKKTNKKKIEEFIRVDHAGERGAIKIYEGQLLALNTLIKDEQLKTIISKMKEHEKEHLEYFEFMGSVCVYNFLARNHNLSKSSIFILK